MSDRPLPQLSVKEQRERTIQLLCDHYAQDRLELEDFEARLDRAHRVHTAAELDRLLQDLPASIPPPTPGPQQQGTIARVAQSMRGTRTLFAFMSGVERSGRWTPGRRNVLIAVMGGAELDFRDVVLPPGETEVFIVCMMGGVGIIVPPGVAVDATGIAIMGAFDHRSPPVTVAPETPLLRVRGVCFMGGAETEVRLPGESEKDAAARRKREQRNAREEQRRLRGEE